MSKTSNFWGCSYDETDEAW